MLQHIWSALVAHPALGAVVLLARQRLHGQDLRRGLVDHVLVSQVDGPAHQPARACTTSVLVTSPFKRNNTSLYTLHFTRSPLPPLMVLALRRMPRFIVNWDSTDPGTPTTSAPELCFISNVRKVWPPSGEKSTGRYSPVPLKSSFRASLWVISTSSKLNSSANSLPTQVTKQSTLPSAGWK
ncbi:hypothetical protein B484DRAFT_447014 [Ochromonadaceae sp. CCMP2298]|nr:hypothetical protein B484DRAFT_447014 [Ochromonadaceae sp. CCMP2298]